MRILIGKIGTAPTVSYAAQELAVYLRKIDPTLIVEEVCYDTYDKTAAGVLFVGRWQEECKDDCVEIAVNAGEGYITGANDRSVLLAVYQYLTALGCRWMRPGAAGEFIPQKSLAGETLTCHYSHTPSYRHRGITIEGSCTYDAVYDMINWLPRVGMNEYFIQMHVPFIFFNRYDETHPTATPALTPDDTARICARLEEEIKRRGLAYHKVGHGWLYPMLGEPCYGRYDPKHEITEEFLSMVALVNGKREIWGGQLVDTNLCYANDEARHKMLSCIVDYCEKTPAADYIHFWLSDARNNQCECEKCRDVLPTDQYVLMLNELDEMLTAKGLDTKIVFLLYNELLWAPVQEKIRNQDRFVMMFAPITRSYKETYCGSMSGKQEPPMLYVRNQIHMPRTVDGNLALLRQWQERFQGDSFVFDYHNMWAHALDAGGYRIARVLHDDMKNLDQIGIDGMVSCQLQRIASPTCLPTYGMAMALWDKQSDFAEVSRRYFDVTFGEGGAFVAEYLASLSEIWDAVEDEARYDKLKARINAALPRLNGLRAKVAGAQLLSYDYVIAHSGLWLHIADAVRLKKSGDDEAAKAAYEACCDYMRQVDPVVGAGLDLAEYQLTILPTNLGFGLLSQKRNEA